MRSAVHLKRRRTQATLAGNGTALKQESTDRATLHCARNPVGLACISVLLRAAPASTRRVGGVLKRSLTCRCHEGQHDGGKGSHVCRKCVYLGVQRRDCARAGGVEGQQAYVVRIASSARWQQTP